MMLSLLPERAATVTAVAAFSGLRKGEIRGLLWEHYDRGEIRVTQSIWNSHVTQPKTRKSKAAVPVVPILCERLDRFRASIGDPQSGLVFAAGNGSPLNLDNLARRDIKPVIEGVGIPWFGWHAFSIPPRPACFRLGCHPISPASSASWPSLPGGQVPEHPANVLRHTR
jgi:integrase